MTVRESRIFRISGHRKPYRGESQCSLVLLRNARNESRYSVSFIRPYSRHDSPAPPDQARRSLPTKPYDSQLPTVFAQITLYLGHKRRIRAANPGDSRQKFKSKQRKSVKVKENPSNEDWDWTALPPSVWNNLLTARNPERYWLSTKSGQVTVSYRITKSLEPALISSAKPKARKHRPRHSRKHPRHSHTKAVLSTIVEDQIQSTTLATTTEIPIVKRTTKRPRSRNPLCYFTALPCAD
ncbi:hypothetical protein DdX_17141 [Ditylenchus destructor]|uniref:Uncharacterized protein n=1 Tax=Ditylenchus destructor TaxID=166010 RepID=A0AAD4MM86_9BILA|nr:hypothetical protein DdX_17141 [Ditylenchus destructor]